MYNFKKRFRGIFVVLFPLLLQNSPVFSQADSCGYDQYIADLIAQVSRPNIESYIQNLALANGHKTRVSYTAGNTWAAEYIKQTFDSFPGITSVEFDTFYATGGIPPYDTIPLVNVIATLGVVEDSARYYIIGGHFDATGNLDPNLNWPADWPTAKAQGADDNATGVAATLEIARILSDPANEFTNHTPLKFIAFGAEERHPAYNNNNHLGSRHYVLQAYANADDILGVYILDMIGYNITGNHYFNIASNTLSRKLGRSMLAVNEAYQIDLGSNDEPFPEVTYSDHDQFWLYRYKAILVIENAPPWQNNLPWYLANPFYHKESDTPATVNYEQVTKIAKMTLATIACLSNTVTGIAPQKPQTRPESFTVRQNYPNPFNPGTTITFELAVPSVVTISIYDVLGRRVDELRVGNHSAGIHELHWEANNLPSGVYYYRLSAISLTGHLNFSAVKKMVLMK